jgi:hypothetical protein
MPPDGGADDLGGVAIPVQEFWVSFIAAPPNDSAGYAEANKTLMRCKR